MDRRLYDPQRFSRAAERTVARAEAWLREVLDPARSTHVTRSHDPGASFARWSRPLPEDGADDVPAAVESLACEYLEWSHRVHVPRSIGHQITPAIPELAVVDLVASLANNSTAIHDMGPVAGALELDLARQMGGLIGYDPRQCGGFLTNGGSLGNLTALLAARTRAGLLGEDFAILVSEQAHYCVQRALFVMNQTPDAVVTVPTDDAFRLRADALEAALDEATRRGRKVLALVASAASTATGAIDPLDACADFCARHGLWLHVDGAHGASLALGPDSRGRLGTGLARADSVVWDAHKMLLTPSLCTALLFRDRGDADRTFAQDASYLFAETPDDVDLEHGRRTVECTKPALALRLRALFDLVGTRRLGAVVDDLVDRARDLTGLVVEDPRFEVLLRHPDANIVCFRLVDPASGEPLADEVQDAARDRVFRSGAYYLTRTRLRGRVWLRSAIMHPETSLDDLAGLLDAVAAASPGA